MLILHDYTCIPTHCPYKHSTTVFEYIVLKWRIIHTDAVEAETYMYSNSLTLFIDKLMGAVNYESIEASFVEIIITVAK